MNKSKIIVIISILLIFSLLIVSCIRTYKDLIWSYPENNSTLEDNTVTLKWAFESEADIDYYDIYYKNTKDRHYRMKENYNATELTLKNLDYHSKYKWYVLGRHNYLNETEGREVEELLRYFFTPNLIPATPSEYAPADASANQATEIRLEWSTCIDPDGDDVTYDVYFGTDQNNLKLISEGQVETEYATDNLIYNTTYFWQIISTDDRIDVMGPVYSFTVKNLSPYTPQSPQPADGSKDQEIDISLIWECEDPDGDTPVYDVYLGEATETLTLVSDNQTERQYNPANLAYNATYFWQIVADDGRDHSLRVATSSDIWKFSTKNATPSAPQNPSPADGAVNQNTVVALSWTCDAVDTDTLTYDVYFGRATDTMTLISDDQTDTRFDSVNIGYNVTYFWQIIVNDGRDASQRAIASGDIWHFTTINATPEAPVGISPVDGSEDLDTSVTLSWFCDPVDADPLTYDVYFGHSTDTLTLVSNDQTGISYATENLENNTTYFWQIGADDGRSSAVRAASFSDIYHFTTKNATPSAPQLLTPSDGATDLNTSVTLSWTCDAVDDDPLVYDVRLGKSTDTMAIVSTHQSTTNYAAENLENNTTYFWQICADDGRTASNRAVSTSPVRSFTTRQLNPISNLQPENHATEVFSGEVAFKWQTLLDSSSATFNVYKGLNPEHLMLSEAQNLSATNCSLFDFDYNTQYYWQIKMFDNGEGTTGPVWEFETADMVYGASATIELESTTCRKDDAFDLIINGYNFETFGPYDSFILSFFFDPDTVLITENPNDVRVHDSQSLPIPVISINPNNRYRIAFTDIVKFQVNNGEILRIHMTGKGISTKAEISLDWENCSLHADSDIDMILHDTAHIYFWE